MSDLRYQDVIRILDLVRASDGVDVDLAMGDLRLRVVRRGSGRVDPPAAKPPVAPAPADPAPAPAAAPVAKAAAPDLAGATPVTAPMGGMFYATPAPGKPPFVTVGQKVRRGEQLGIVEVMKLFTPITAEADGTGAAILVENQQTVERGAVLMLIRAEG